jgi:CBS domain-containing protein
MDLSSASEFADEYQDWLEGHPGAMRAPWFDQPVGQLEPRPLPALSPEASLRAAVAMLNAHDRGALLLISGERLVGIFTERDVLRRVVQDGLDLDQTRVADVMTRAPEVLSTSTTLAQALRAMVRARYHHLPIVDSAGGAIGMVSLRQILEFVCETFPKEILNAPPEHESGTFVLDGG